MRPRGLGQLVGAPWPVRQEISDPERGGHVYRLGYLEAVGHPQQGAPVGYLAGAHRTSFVHGIDPSLDRHLEDATEDLVKHLTTLADKHAAAIGKYPALVGREPSETSGGKKTSKEKGPVG